jgi:predicted nucleotidyltransferase
MFLTDDNLNNSLEIEEIVKVIKDAVPVLEIYLFGSFVNGVVTDSSDYDFYVVVPDEVRAIEATRKIRSALPKQKRSIDMLVGTLSKFNKYKSSLSFIEREVAETGMKLYG